MFKVGDKVIFKTGKGPVMVVVKVNHLELGRVLCKWWNEETHQYKTKDFLEEELELYEEEE